MIKIVKNIFFYVIVAAFMSLATGCNKGNSPAENGSRVSFTATVNSVTRATLVYVDSELQNVGFGVSAYESVSGAKFMDKVPVSYIDGEWTYSGEYLWKDFVNMKFFAWSPADAGEGLTVSASGIADFVYSPRDVFDGTDVNGQYDLMFADYEGSNDEGVCLSFSHPLASVRFVVGSNFYSGVTSVSQIGVAGIYDSATLSVGPACSYTWSNFGTVRSDEFLFQEVAGFVNEPGREIGEPLILIPQAFSGSSPLEFTMYAVVDGKMRSISATIDSGSLVAGHLTTYTLDFLNGDYISVSSVSVDPWGEEEGPTANVVPLDDYVEIVGTDGITRKWKKENLAVTASGKQKWGNTNHIVGDYFQWGAYVGYAGDGSAADKGLVIYESFTLTYCGGPSNTFMFKDASKTFNLSSVPHYDGSNYTKYVAGDTLLPEDDPAAIICGSGWHTPTLEDFQCTFGVLNRIVADDGAYLVPKGETLAADRSNALLFFPRMRRVFNEAVNTTSNYGYYWTSSLETATNPQWYGVCSSSGTISRPSGMAIRPVSY